VTRWSAVWERKGELDTRDLVELDGFEHTRIDAEGAALEIAALLAIEPKDRILEVGCGAGMIAQYLTCDYLGVDYAGSLTRKMRQILGRQVVRSEARHLPFRDGAFDKALLFSVCHYFPDHAYAHDAIAELRRVARKAIFVGDLPLRSHSPDHLLFEPHFFAGWEISPGFYRPERFNALKRLG